MSRSATPATRNAKITPSGPSGELTQRHGHIAIARTVASGCGRLGNGNPCYAFGERKGKEGNGRDRKGKGGKGMERTGKERKGRERKGKEGKGRERKGKDGKGRERKGKDGKGREGRERKGEVDLEMRPPSHDRAQMSLLGYCTLSLNVSVQS